MEIPAMKFDEVVSFHGHACPGLAMGFRASLLALREMGVRARDEELVAVAENNSCAVDSVQVVCGCTFGKGNLVFVDNGKQVYTFIRRPSGAAVRIAVIWEPPAESPLDADFWRRYSSGERSSEVMAAVQHSKSRKIKMILEAPDRELFAVKHQTMKLPDQARVYASIRCGCCGEKVMEPKAVRQGGMSLCIPCAAELSATA